MDTVVIAFEQETAARKMGDLLESAGVARCLICRSGDQVRRLVSDQGVYCVVCAPYLSDGPAEWLCGDLPPACSLLMVGPRHMLDACTSPDVFKLSTPVRREEAVCTVRLLLQFGRRMERTLRPRRRGQERELVERAKGALMARKDYTEEMAHRALQKRSMDGGRPMAQVAREVLRELGEDGPD